MPERPVVTVVMASFNRGERVRRAVASVLEQEGPEVELVVVDSSTDDTAAVLATIDDPRLRVLVRPDLGMPVARNQGLAEARGEWVGFLDDDDALRPGWARELVAAADDRTLVVMAGHRRVTPDGEVLVTEAPGPLGVAARVFVAGTFLVRRDLVRELGGMLEGLPQSHHWDLAVRLGTACGDRPGAVVRVDQALTDIEVRPATGRELSTPLQLFDGFRWALARHRVALADRPDVTATLRDNVAVAAARMGRWGEARAWAWGAVRARPGRPARWARAALVCVPPLARRTWGDLSGYTAEAHASRRGLAGLDALVQARGPSVATRMLPFGYREGDGAGPPASRRMQRMADGAGAASTLVAALADAEDPQAVLRAAATGLAPGERVVVVELDRDAVDGPLHLGPPTDGARRHWTPDELVLLVEAAGLVVERSTPTSPTRHRRTSRAPIVVLARRS